MKLTSTIDNNAINNLTNITIIINAQQLVNCYDHKCHRYIEINHHSANSVKKSYNVNQYLFAKSNKILALVIVITNNTSSLSNIINS